MTDAPPPLLPLAVRLLRERGASFAEAYLMRQWNLSMSDAADLVTQAQKVRYSRTFGGLLLGQKE